MISRRRKSGDGTLAIGPALVDLLLEGWGAPVRPEQSDAFDVLRLEDADLIAEWREHRGELLAEAAQRGLQRPLWIETKCCPGWPKDLDFALAQSAMNGAPLPEWARRTWDATRLAELRARLLKLLDGNGDSAA